MKDLIDSSRSRIDNKTQWKDFTLILGSISDVSAGVLANSISMQRNLNSYGQSVRIARERASVALRQTELSLRAAVADNNRIRRKFGLETVSVNNFLQQQSGPSLPVFAVLVRITCRDLLRFAMTSFLMPKKPARQYESDEEDEEDDHSMTSEYLDNDDEVLVTMRRWRRIWEMVFTTTKMTTRMRNLMTQRLQMKLFSLRRHSQIQYH
ncbi:hypothetical protein BC829DRAFT_151807 [Chytridium lagenaria]|nr:hypothetical protein BC829DRAFT_151807 [Chytridium lagenaria]